MDNDTTPIGTYEMQNELGMTVRVSISSLDEIYAIQRKYGPRGWRPGGIPAGGYGPFPYAMAERFDFALIGAKLVTIGDERVVVYNGQIYKRRDMAEQKKGDKKIPAQITYSRAAKATDPEAIRESSGESMNLGYVTLVRFRGNGPVVAEYCRQTSG